MEHLPETKDELEQMAREFHCLADHLRTELQHAKTEAAHVGEVKAMLREKTAQLRAIMDSAVDGIIAIDERGLVESFNHAAAVIFGDSSDEMIGCHISMLIPHLDSDQHNDDLSLRLHSDEAGVQNMRREVAGKQKDGHLFPMSLVMSKIRCGKGRLLTGMTRDSTETKQMERQRIEASQQKHTAEFESLIMAINNTQAVIEFNLEGAVLTANENFLQMTGYTLKEIQGRHHRMFCESSYVERPEYQAFWTKLHCGEFHAGTYLRMGNGGREVWIQATYNPMVNARGQVYKVIKLATDITSRVKLEETLKAREATLVDVTSYTQNIVNTTADSIVTIDEQGMIQSFNKSACETFGYSETEVLGKNVSLLMPAPYRNEHDGYLAQYRQTGEHHIIGTIREALGQRKNGTHFPIDLAISEFRIGSRRMFTGVIRDISTRKQAKKELVLHKENLQDLVAQRTRELSLAKESAEQANRAKSEFLSNMSHELRTPMHAILSFAGMASDKLNTVPSEKILHYLTRVQESGARLLELVNDLLDLSKLESGKMTLALQKNNLRTIVEKVVADCELLLKAKGVAIHIQEPKGSATVECDTMKIGQVVLNLLSNAIKFTSQGKTITIDIQPDILSIGRRKTDVRTLPALAFIIRDEGVGVPHDELESVFDKFVQSSKTKTGAGGTGLGLAICKEIIEIHGGKIWAENRPEGGTSFFFLLPLQHPITQNSLEETNYEQQPTNLASG